MGCVYMMLGSWVMFLFLFWYAVRLWLCVRGILCHQLVIDASRTTETRHLRMLWPLVLLFSLPWGVRPQSTHTPLSLDSPLSLSADNFSTSTSTPVLFSLPSSSQLTISVALCASPSSNAPRVFVSNSTDSQLVPGPNGGSDVFEVTLSGLGLGNLTLDVADSTGLLAVYGGTTLDNLEIGVSQGGMATNLPSPSLFSQTHHLHIAQRHRSTSRSKLCPTLATRLRTKQSSFPHLSSHLLPHPNQHIRIIHSQQRTRRPHHSHHHQNPPQHQTLHSSLPRSTRDSPRSRKPHARSAHA